MKLNIFLSMLSDLSITDNMIGIVCQPLHYHHTDVYNNTSCMFRTSKKFTNT